MIISLLCNNERWTTFIFNLVPPISRIVDVSFFFICMYERQYRNEENVVLVNIYLPRYST